MWGPALEPLRIKRFQLLAVALIVSVAIIGIGGSGIVSTWGANPVALHSYNITFTEAVVDGSYCAGFSRYGFASDHNFSVEVKNVTWVFFSFAWSDSAGSPLTDPDVDLDYSTPNGTIVYQGPAPPNRITWNMSLNAIPDDTTVRASTPEEALSIAGTEINETLGMGTWNWTLTVGEVPYEQGRIRSQINYECWWGYGWIEMTLENATSAE